MAEQSPVPLNNESKATAGLGGAGGGTLLIVIANSLPEDSRLKPLLIWAAPTFSVFLGAIFIWLQFRLKTYLQEREANTVFQEAKQTISDALANPTTSEAHRVKLRKELEKLEMLSIKRHIARIRSLKIITEDDLGKISEP